MAIQAKHTDAIAFIEREGDFFKNLFVWMGKRKILQRQKCRHMGGSLAVQITHVNS